MDDALRSLLAHAGLLTPPTIAAPQKPHLRHVLAHSHGSVMRETRSGDRWTLGAQVPGACPRAGAVLRPFPFRSLTPRIPPSRQLSSPTSHLLLERSGDKDLPRSSLQWLSAIGL
ncbi:hypothetical protein J6590_023658 [Homalodisca vitripennis]|nr:hypothetical protein J6590_023658 [Homalodisca vitripennis]